MLEVKIVQAPKSAQTHKNNRESLYSDLEAKITELSKEGWEIIGTGPERDVLLKRGAIVEFLRAIPIINIIINWLFPLEVESSISIIMKK